MNNKQIYNILPLNIPLYTVKITSKDNKSYIWDILRRKHVILTPEEWVRQQFVHYLVHEKGYPVSLMNNEISLSLNNTCKRCDTVIYNRDLTPLVIVEYKAPHITIKQQVFDQITRYNIVMQVPYLIVSNGLKHYCCKVDYSNKSYCFLREIPRYDEVTLTNMAK